MKYEDAYRNVDKGLLEASEHIRKAYETLNIRYILEALLIDSETPEELYKDLLGWVMLDVTEYKKYFFDIPDNMPRLLLFEFIDSVPKVTKGDHVRYNLLLGVFEYGWAYIDTEYNKGSRMSIQSRAMSSLKKMFGKVDRMVVDCMGNPTTSNVRDVLRIMNEALKVDALTKAAEAPEQLRLQFVEKIQETAAATRISTEEIMDVEFDDLHRLKPVSERKDSDQRTILDALEDIKGIEDD